MTLCQLPREQKNSRLKGVLISGTNAASEAQIETLPRYSCARNNTTFDSKMTGCSHSHSLELAL